MECDKQWLLPKIRNTPKSSTGYPSTTAEEEVFHRERHIFFMHKSRVYILFETTNNNNRSVLSRTPERAQIQMMWLPQHVNANISPQSTWTLCWCDQHRCHCHIKMVEWKHMNGVLAVSTIPQITTYNQKTLCWGIVKSRIYTRWNDDY